jgi:hypothetical protein
VDSSIKFNVSANTAQFQSGMRQVDTVAKSTAAGIKQAFSGVGSMLAGGAVIGAMTGLLKKMDDISDGARRIGISAEEFQKIGNAADLVGTSVEAVNRSMIRAGVAANKAAREGGDMAEAFSRASLDPAKFAAAGLEERIKMVAEAQRAANGDARQMSELFEAIGVKAAGIDFSALAQEMANVNAASNDTVETLARANDELDKAKQNATIFGASLLKALVNDPAERLGSLMADLGGIAKLSAAIPLALTGNVMPLWHVLQTGKTIKEMEEIEARASAINQLTREGAFGIEAEKNAALIAGRTQQILTATRDINQQMSISEETLDSSLGLEKEKTAELAKQAEQLARQEAQRQGAIRDMGAEIALIEAQLSGNKKLEESLREQADFQSAFEKTGDTEEAAKFAAVKAAERAAQAGKQGGGSSGGGFSSGGVNRSALDRLQEMSRGSNVDARTALMRLQAEQDRFAPRAAELEGSGMFRSAAAAQIRNEERMQDRAMRELTKQTRDQFFGSRNAGDAARNFERDALKSGMTTSEAMTNMGIDRKLGESTRDALDRFAKEQAKTETERAREQADSGGVGGGGGRGGGAGEQPATEATLKQIFEKIQERPILVA